MDQGESTEKESYLFKDVVNNLARRPRFDPTVNNYDSNDMLKLGYLKE